MRLRPEKIQRLAELVYETLHKVPDVSLEGDRDAILLLIRRVITDDMRAEEEIEEAARKLLEPLRDEIMRKGASFDKMLLKTKQKLAQERRMVL